MNPRRVHVGPLTPSKERIPCVSARPSAQTWHRCQTCSHTCSRIHPASAKQAWPHQLCPAAAWGNDARLLSRRICRVCLEGFELLLCLPKLYEELVSLNSHQARCLIVLERRRRGRLLAILAGAGLPEHVRPTVPATLASHVDGLRRDILVLSHDERGVRRGRFFLLIGSGRRARAAGLRLEHSILLRSPRKASISGTASGLRRGLLSRRIRPMFTLSLELLLRLPQFSEELVPLSLQQARCLIVLSHDGRGVWRVYLLLLNGNARHAQGAGLGLRHSLLPSSLRRAKVHGTVLGLRRRLVGSSTKCSSGRQRNHWSRRCTGLRFWFCAGRGRCVGRTAESWHFLHTICAKLVAKRECGAQVGRILFELGQRRSLCCLSSALCPLVGFWVPPNPIGHGRRSLLAQMVPHLRSAMNLALAHALDVGLHGCLLARMHGPLRRATSRVAARRAPRTGATCCTEVWRVRHGEVGAPWTWRAGVLPGDYPAPSAGVVHHELFRLQFLFLDLSLLDFLAGRRLRRRPRLREPSHPRRRGPRGRLNEASPRSRAAPLRRHGRRASRGCRTRRRGHLALAPQRRCRRRPSHPVEMLHDSGLLAGVGQQIPGQPAAASARCTEP
mmetsp:Transcript_35474/g.98012  ORF Transcript_35474/g.98012 Transcript_35474/m.98012 type:complete len:615 (+) Transcript_35474:85-1929(+)